jgi:uncharacterized membrane protein
VSQCLGYELGSGILVAVCLVAGGVLFWLALKFIKDGNTNLSKRKVGTPGNAAGAPNAGSGPISRLFDWPTYRWVCLLVALFFAASFFAESWQYLHLAPFDDDLAINQQVLSSTILGGKPYLFYESFNCGFHGQCSYLLVHQAFFGFAVALAYGIAPTPYTLFAIQSLAVGLAALPLYALSVDVIGVRRLSLGVAGAYLAWVPLMILATRDTFNWEAFIPVEILTLFWLWNRQRYLLAVPVILVAFLTYEVIPVLVFFVGLYFLWPWLLRAVYLLCHAVTSRPTRPRSIALRLRLWGRWVWKALQVPEVHASLALMACSVAAYILLKLFLLDGGWLLGLPPVPSAYALPVNSPNKVFVLTFSALSYDWTSKLLFWIVIYLTLGFIPLFAPRTLLLVLPWTVLSVFNETPAFWSFGGHYVVPAAAALLIGFTFGLNQLYLWSFSQPAAPTRDRATDAGPSKDAGIEPDDIHPSGQRPWTLAGSNRAASSKATGVIALGVVIIIAGNLYLCPLNPLASSVVPILGPPFPSPYGIDFPSPPNEQPLQQLVSIIPKGAIVTAPTSVFSLVANDPYAYPMRNSSGFNLTLLPGKESSRLEYVLVPYNTPNGDFNSTPLRNLYDRFDWGVRGCVTNSAAGGVELFQRNYTGSPKVFGPPDSLCPNYYSGGGGLIAGPSASTVNNSSSPSGVAVQSTPCATSGLVWTGPGISLAPGKYAMRLIVSSLNSTDASCRKSHLNPTRAFFSMNITGQNVSGFEVFTHRTFTVGSCSSICNSWYYWNTTITLLAETNDFSTTGTLLIGQYVVQIAYLIIVPEQG